jgi:uncharacterized phage-like protein YoqJ
VTETWTNVMVTAHRKLPKGCIEEWLGAALRERLVKLRDEYGMERATSGMAIGGDTLFAEVALELGLPLYGAVAFPGQHERWPKVHQRRWRELIERATHVDYVSERNPSSFGEAAGMLHARNRFMLERNDAVVAIWAPGNHRGGTYDCIKQAVGAGKPVILFNLAAKTVTRPSRRRWAELLNQPALAAAAHI